MYEVSTGPPPTGMFVPSSPPGPAPSGMFVPSSPPGPAPPASGPPPPPPSAAAPSFEGIDEGKLVMMKMKVTKKLRTALGDKWKSTPTAERNRMVDQQLASELAAGAIG